ncbi:AEC family transporter [Methanocorpusculum vombati]|uniref:AEC family transporter n=1 Tax=Methanocorpusculum vombati TaxID=3002864 RepID=A0ABT4INF6_9EURY|nr:AEC family transporter [Methanocorpusculum vombati]MCZ9319316.1 AEC family transporter [Methanocorpusculum sp.]MCZ0863297.1 AEC family transporter [Methanocorpusculum vombati]MDE2519876.1 AEC family transporter [Methanocorpusculum sp.]MDE2533537.1 AEC family transporter [Methanocorpusculum sp.]MDE2545859.1 AEC family transporter [Methanocorpusculum sp.]
MYWIVRGPWVVDYFIALNQILILFLLIGVGFFCRRVGILHETSVTSLSKFLLHICIPAMIIYSMQIPVTSELLQNSELLIVAAFGYYAVSLVVAWFAPILLRARHEEYGVFRFMLVFSNSMFMGFPVLSMIFGPEAIFYAAIFNIPFTILAYSLGIWLLTVHGGGEGRPVFQPKLLVNAAFFLTFVGLALFLTSTTIPDPINGSLELLASVTTPLSLVVTGGFLAQLDMSRIFGNVRQYFVAGIRLLVLPALVYVIFSPFIADPLILGVVVVTAGMPAATNTVMLASEHRVHPDIAAQGVFITTLMSVVTLPFLAMFLS